MKQELYPGSTLRKIKKATALVHGSLFNHFEPMPCGQAQRGQLKFALVLTEESVEGD